MRGVSVVPRQNRLLRSVGPVVALMVLLLAIIDPDPKTEPFETIAVGWFLGTAFGLTTVAACWTALGPLSLSWRLPLSLLLVSLLGVAMTLNIAINGGPQDGGVVVGMCLFGQWLLLQIPLWALVIVFGLRLRHADETLAFDHRERQFGIRQLILVTTIVGITLGIARAVVVRWEGVFSVTRGEAPIFIFLAIASVVLTLPLVLSVLLRRQTVPAVLVTLVLIGLVTAWEMPLLNSMHGSPGPSTRHFVAINLFTAIAILLVMAAVRLNGYSLARSQASAKT